MPNQVEIGKVKSGQVLSRTVQVGKCKVGIGQPQTGQVLTWDCTKMKMKTYTWNASVALLSLTCDNGLLIEIILQKQLYISIYKLHKYSMNIIHTMSI